MIQLFGLYVRSQALTLLLMHILETAFLEVSHFTSFCKTSKEFKHLMFFLFPHWPLQSFHQNEQATSWWVLFVFWIRKVTQSAPVQSKLLQIILFYLNDLVFIITENQSELNAHAERNGCPSQTWLHCD